jgi:hypothetical protein
VPVAMSTVSCMCAFAFWCMSGSVCMLESVCPREDGSSAS